MKNNPVGWFEIYVHDLDRARQFYEAVFKAQLTKLDSPAPDAELLAFPMDTASGGAAGALVKMDSCTPSGNGTLVYFTCDDCATESSRVAAAGGKVVKPKFSIGPYGFIALAVDTEGNTFGMHSMK